MVKRGCENGFCLYSFKQKQRAKFSSPRATLRRTREKVAKGEKMKKPTISIYHINFNLQVFLGIKKMGRSL